MVQGKSVVYTIKRIRLAVGVAEAGKATGGQEITKMVFYVMIFPQAWPCYSSSSPSQKSYNFITTNA